jgi:hypothetical protein
MLMNNLRLLRLGKYCTRIGLLLVGLLLASLGELLAQGAGQTIRGKVLDEEGEGLPMASILVVGTKQGTTTSAKGDFTLKLPAGKTQLLIRYIGYKEMRVTAKDGMTIRMEPCIFH